ncbi:hypothetical protein A4S05_05150 [Nostoc sp. KVJ20]|nr:hypothetical protein A4S05_05150 [Nostoc sp. KVJ20]
MARIGARRREQSIAEVSSIVKTAIASPISKEKDVLVLLQRSKVSGVCQREEYLKGEHRGKT